MKNLKRLGSSYKIGDGKSTKFWDDVWLGEIPLKIAFPYIYKICSDPGKTVHQMYDNGQWRIDLRRSLGENDIDEWSELQGNLTEVQLNSDKDVMQWKLNKFGKFSTKSLYRELLFGGVKDLLLQEIWNSFGSC